MISNLFKPQKSSGILSAFCLLNRSVTTPNNLFYASAMRCFSTNAQMRVYGEKVTLRYPPDFAKNILSGPQRLQVNKRKMPVRVDKQPIPLNDYIDFKKMTSGNEVLINLDNCDNLRNGELISGLIELGRRDKA